MAEAEEAAAAPGTSTGPSSASRRAPRRNLGHLPRGLERIEHVIEPDSTQCPCGCGQMIRIGEDRTERLDIVPAQLRVIVTVRPKYACRTCEAGVIQAPAPAHLITGGLPTEGALAQVLIAKYGDHLPLYRQSQIYARSGVELHRSTLAGWVGKASFHLTPVVDRLAWHLKQSGQLFMDETRAPVLDPGRGKTKTGYLWALARDERPWAGPDPPGVVFFYAPGRGGRHAERFLEGFNGILQVDGYAGYNAVAAPGKGVTRAYCWAHARRKLCEIHDSHRSEVAAQGLRRIAAMYAIEKQIRGEPAEVRLGVRQARTAPRVKEFGVVAEAATRPGLAEVAPGREAGLHRQSLGRATGVPHRWPRGDGFKRGGKHDPPAGSESQECAVRRPRRGGGGLGPHSYAGGNGQDEQGQPTCLPQGHARGHRRRPPGLGHRSAAALGLYANLTLKSRWRRDTASPIARCARANRCQNSYARADCRVRPRSCRLQTWTTVLAFEYLENCLWGASPTDRRSYIRTPNTYEPVPLRGESLRASWTIRFGREEFLQCQIRWR